MMKHDPISILLRTLKTVFSFKDICILWNETDINRVGVKINYYVKKGELINIKKGFYVIDVNYSRYELANKILTPSYISLETVLFNSGIIFQKYSSIFLVSYTTREITVDGQTYSFKKIKSDILSNTAGIENSVFSIATPERAFLDTIYLNRDYYFDNLKSLNWDKVFSLSSIYRKIRLEKEIKKLYKTINYVKRN
jgi:predicted transcriptional regulator of viral defense system